MKLTPTESAALRRAYIERLALTVQGWWSASDEDRAAAMEIRKRIEAPGRGQRMLPRIPPTPEECGAHMEKLREIARQKADEEARKSLAEAAKNIKATRKK